MFGSGGLGALLLQTTDASGRVVTINQAQGSIVSASPVNGIVVNGGTATVVSSASSVVAAAVHQHQQQAAAAVAAVAAALPTAAVTVTSMPSIVTVPQGSSSQSLPNIGVNKREGRTSNQNNQNVSRPYVCGVCAKAFIRNEHLRRHVLTHSGEKPYSCNTCGKAFSRREHLTKHVRSHTRGSVVVTDQEHLANNIVSSTVQQHLCPPGGSTPSASTPTPLHQTTIQVVGAVSSQSAQTVVHQQQDGSIHHGSVVQQQQPSLTVETHSSLPTPGTIIAASSGGGQVMTSGHQTVVAHAGGIQVPHTVAASHTAHLPPGTHYLPMFGLLAEVV